MAHGVLGTSCTEQPALGPVGMLIGELYMCCAAAGASSTAATAFKAAATATAAGSAALEAAGAGAAASAAAGAAAAGSLSPAAAGAGALGVAAALGVLGRGGNKGSSGGSSSRDSAVSARAKAPAKAPPAPKPAAVAVKQQVTTVKLVKPASAAAATVKKSDGKACIRWCDGRTATATVTG